METELFDDHDSVIEDNFIPLGITVNMFKKAASIRKD